MNRALAKNLARSIDTLETKIDESKEGGAVKLSAKDARYTCETLRNSFLYVTGSSYDGLVGSLVRVMKGEKE